MPHQGEGLRPTAPRPPSFNPSYLRRPDVWVVIAPRPAGLGNRGGRSARLLAVDHELAVGALDETTLAIRSRRRPQ